MLDGRIVFISYSHEDGVFVNLFAAKLLSYDLNVWKDSKDIAIGGNIPKSIYDGIKRASHFCCIISNSSIKSAWVEEELAFAKIRQLGDRGLRIVPVLIDQVEIPDYLKAYLCAHLENRDLSVKNQEFLKILKAFGVDLQEYSREMITGKPRQLLLARCHQFRAKLTVFREILFNFQNAVGQYETALYNRSAELPELDLGIVLRPTTAGSDYRINAALKHATRILKQLRVCAADVQTSLQLAKRAWKEADPSSSVARFGHLFGYELDALSYISEMISAANDDLSDWWIGEKLEQWTVEVPRAEASLEAVIELLKSWANFDPKEE